MSTSKAAPRPIALGDKVIFKCVDQTPYQTSIKRNAWHTGIVDHIYVDGSLSIEFYNKMRVCTMLTYVHTKSPLGRVIVIRKVGK